jgi:3-oxoacyl-[acyl-carrier protein] reductase
MSALSDKVAVVTGAGRGIGAATAQRLAAEGAAVAVVDLVSSSTTGTVAAIRAAGGVALGVECDVSDSGAVTGAFAEIHYTLGSVDVLVNNAGVIRDNLLFKMTDDDWDVVMAVHLRGSFLCCREAQRSMVERRWGKIVNLSSESALGSRGQANYSAAKAGLQGFTRTLAIELGPFNINVNAVAPGFIETPMTHATAERMGIEFEEMKRDATPSIPLRRIGRPDDVAGVVALLCGPDASYISGQTIYVTGGPSQVG